MSRPANVQFTGRILYLTKDPEDLARQLRGETLEYDPNRELVDNISTDEITPGWVCFHYDETLGKYTMVGLRDGTITEDAVRGGGFDILVAGESMGCGSSREQAPFSQC